MLVVPFSGSQHQGSRRALAQAQAGTAMPGGLSIRARSLGTVRSLHLGTEPVCALDLAGNVIADVNHSRGLRASGKKRVEIRHAESFSRRDVQFPAGVVQRTRADPADAILNGMENRQQVSAFRTGSSNGHAVNCRDFFRRGCGSSEMQVHDSR